MTNEHLRQMAPKVKGTAAIAIAMLFIAWGIPMTTASPTAADCVGYGPVAGQTIDYVNEEVEDASPVQQVPDIPSDADVIGDVCAWAIAHASLSLGLCPGGSGNPLGAQCHKAGGSGGGDSYFSAGTATITYNNLAAGTFSWTCAWGPVVMGWNGCDHAWATEVSLPDCGAGHAWTNAYLYSRVTTTATSAVGNSLSVQAYEEVLYCGIPAA